MQFLRYQQQKRMITLTFIIPDTSTFIYLFFLNMRQRSQVILSHVSHVTK